IKENWDVLTPFATGHSDFKEDYWSAQWTGTIHPPVTGMYTFYLYHDGKVSLVLDDEVVIDGAVATENLEEDSVQVWLEAGENVNLRLEYDHYDHLARVELDWRFSIVERYTVPFSKNYPRENLSRDEDGVVLFPNPTPDPIVYIYMDPEIYSETQLEIHVMDADGRFLRSISGVLDNGIYPLSVSDLSDGFYYLKVIYGKNIKTLKLVKFR
ncbi:MAG: PA14 domain-containing protein, partial [Bacteroidota bacterium]